MAGLVEQLEGVDKNQAMTTLNAYNTAVDTTIDFDPTILDGKRTNGLAIDKTNWANTLDTPPFKAYPVTCGITFTYGGLKIDEKTRAVLRENNTAIEGLYACGELVGGVFLLWLSWWFRIDFLMLFLGELQGMEQSLLLDKKKDRSQSFKQ